MSIEAAPFSAPDPEELAALFPGYAIHSLIACGGMGAVYHATQIALDRPVAIKILPREFSSDAAFREGFAAEAKAMAKLNHPNLIGVYDFGEVAGMLFIIMEFVSGQSLYDATYKTAIEPREAARLMAEICAGLAEAHQHGILHRDIKPANILLDANLRPKIGDFGLARPIGAATQAGEAIFGTPHYTAPEVTYHAAQVDARADVFSLGVVLHELLTGKLPADDNRSPSAISKCSPKFDAIVKRATQRVPSLRYPDAGSMAKDLAELTKAPAAGVARPGPSGIKVPPKGRRAVAHRPVATSSSGSSWFWITLLIGAAAGAFYLFTKKAPPPENVAPIVEEAPPAAETHTPPVVPRVSRDAKPELPGTIGQTQGSTDSAEGVFGTKEPPGPVHAGPKPIFGVENFLTRARGIMKEKASAERKAYERSLAENVEKFDRAVTRKARSEGTAALASANKALDGVRAAGNRIPVTFEVEDLPKSDYEEALDAAKKAQEEAEETYAASLKPHAATYIRGIEMQIGRLVPSEDPGAVNALKEEVESTKTDDHYFPDILEN